MIRALLITFFSSTKKKVVVWFSSPIFHTASRHFFVAENLSQRGSKSLNSLGESQKIMNSSARFPQHTYDIRAFPGLAITRLNMYLCNYLIQNKIR